MQPPRNKIECLLLTWHGTLLCSTAGTTGICHKPLPDALPSAVRLNVHTALDPKFAQLLPLSDLNLPYESRTLGDGSAKRAGIGRGFNFPRGAHFLCAPEKESQVAWNRQHAETWESFLPVPVDLLIRLADLTARDWIDLAGAERISGRDIAFKREFMLSVGQFDIDLAKTYPTFFSPLGTAPPSEPAQVVFVVGHGDRIAAFASANDQTTPGSPGRFWLRQAEGEEIDAPRGRQPSKATVESLDAPELNSPEFLYFPPAFAHRDDRAFFVSKGWNGSPRLGYLRSRISVRRAYNCHLMLSRELEGVVFDSVGVRRCYGFLAASKNPPKELLKDGDRFLLNRQIIDDAPALDGDYLVFYNGNLQNYYHWMVEAVLSLYMLCKVCKGNARIVLPAALGQASKLPYLESLKLLGFGDIELTLAAAPVVKLKSATWVTGSGDPIDDFPPHVLREFQSHVAASLALAAGQQRLYIEREHVRRVDNADEVRDFLERAGFVTVRLDGMSLLEQVALFASAEFVVGPHGAGLSNLMFSPPSTRVIEFTPNSEMRPFFWLISSKMGHEYGMLPCETHNGSFNGDLRVDLRKLSTLLAFLEHA
jgi:capsular polysaccharide biosynthesis protein